MEVRFARQITCKNGLVFAMAVRRLRVLLAENISTTVLSLSHTPGL